MGGVGFGASVWGGQGSGEGIEQMAGLFINRLPVRVRLSPDVRIVDWLEQLQSNFVEAQQYEFTPLSRIRMWSELMPNVPLFEALVVFENYAMNVFEESYHNVL